MHLFSAGARSANLCRLKVTPLPQFSYLIVVYYDPIMYHESLWPNMFYVVIMLQFSCTT